MTTTIFVNIIFSIIIVIQALFNFCLFMRLHRRTNRRIRRVVIVYYKKEIAGTAVNMLAASQLISRLSVEANDNGSNDVRMEWTDLVHPIYVR